MGADRPTLRAFLWCPAAALQYLAMEHSITCTLRLAAKHHRNAASRFITLMEYRFRQSPLRHTSTERKFL